MDAPILVIVDEPVATASVKVATLARELTDGIVYALASADSQAALAECGVDEILVPEGEGYNPRVAAGVAAAAEAAVAKIGTVGAILTTATYLGRAVSATLGVKLGSGVGVDVASVREEDGHLVGEKSALGGSWSTTFEVLAQPPILALRPGAGSEVTVAPGAARLVPLAVSLPRAATAVTVEESVLSEPGEGVALADADVVVVGGRGVEGDFDLVERLSGALGAAVGSTRVACDEGWVDRATQIGQTGVSIAPKVYVGLGVFGAVHHTSGMMASETIVAIVDDPDAPILEMADLGIVGDVSEVVPQALDALGVS